MYCVAAYPKILNTYCSVFLCLARNVLEGQPCTGPQACDVITDGVFMPENTFWNIGSVFWDDRENKDVYSIVLDHNETIRSFRLQYDCQDTYHVLFRYASHVFTPGMN